MAIHAFQKLIAEDEGKHGVLNQSTMIHIVNDTGRATLMVLEKIKYTDIELLQTSAHDAPLLQTALIHTFDCIATDPSDFMGI